MEINTKKNGLSELDRFFELYRQFWPNKKIQKNMKLAWGLALEPFSYEDVKAAAVAHARTKKFPPDVSDLTAGLVQEEPELGTDELRWMDAYIALYADRPVNPVIRYASQHGVTIGDAEAALGITWAEAQEANNDL